jgi:ABC-type uncharacterized transport system involved in gliding motility auxiliary subunit
MKSFWGIFGAIVLIFGLLGLLFLGDPLTFPIVGLHLGLGFVALVYWFFKSGMQGLGEASSAVVGRKARFGFSAGVYLLVFVALLSAVNWLANANNKRWDLTQEGVFSLSAQSKTVIQNLKRPLKLVAFKSVESDISEQAKSLFELYTYVNPSKITTEIVDPRTKPHLVEKYEMKAGNLLYLQLGEDSDAKKSVFRINQVDEQSLTNAVVKLTRGDSKKVYFLEGHGEPGLDNTDKDGLKALALAISDENLVAESIFLGDKESIPEDAAAVLVVSPKRSIPQREKDLLQAYAEKGGRLLLFTDPVLPGAEPVTDVAELSAKFGITIGTDVVVDLVQRLFGPMALGAEIVARDYASHPVTKGFGTDSITIFNLASSVSIPASDNSKQDAPTYQSIVKSGKSSWAERNLAKLFDAKEPSADFSEPDDLKGPVAIAVSYEKNLSEAEQTNAENDPKFESVSRVMVFGDSDFLRNQSIQSYANRDLILNAVNWMVGEEGGLDIRPRSIKASIAPITRSQLMGILSMGLVVPELLLLLGLFVWWSRRATSR